MSRRSGKDPIDEEEQQRLRNEEEARRIEALRKEKEQEPIPQSVLQYVSPPLITVPWSPFGFGGDPGVTQDELWEDLGSDVNISYEEMNQFLNEEERQEWEERQERQERQEREERQERDGSSSSSSDGDGGGGGGGGGGGEEDDDMPVPQVLIELKRGRRSTSGSGFVVNVRGM